MRELVLYPEKTRFAYWAAAVFSLFVALALLGGIDLEWGDIVKLSIAGVAFALTMAGLYRHERNPLPRLRLSEDGIEGVFGLVRWSDVVDVDTRVDWSVYSRGRDVVVRLREGAAVFPPTRQFASGPLLYDDAMVSRQTLKIMRGSLAPDARELAAEIRWFRSHYGLASD